MLTVQLSHIVSHLPKMALLMIRYVFNSLLNDEKDWQSLMFFESIIHKVGPTFENTW